MILGNPEDCAMSGAALIALALTSFAWRGQTGFAGFAREVRAGLPEGDRASGVKPILFAREGRAWRPRVSFCTGGQSVEVEKNRTGIGAGCIAAGGSIRTVWDAPPSRGGMG